MYICATGMEGMVWRRSVVFNLGKQPPEGSCTIFGGVVISYIFYVAVLYLLYSGFIWGLLGYSGLVGLQYKKG